MAVFIPKFLLKDLSLLHSKFGNEDFIFPDAEKLLKHDVRYSNQILSKLGKSGYISKRRDPTDGRKRIYQINKVKFEDIMKDTRKESHDENE